MALHLHPPLQNSELQTVPGNVLLEQQFIQERILPAWSNSAILRIAAAAPSQVRHSVLMEILDSHKIQNILKTPINQPSFCDCSASHREKKKIKKTDVNENASCLDFFILMINTEQILLVTVFTNTTFSTALDNKNKLHYKIPLKVSVKLKDKKAKHHFIKASRGPRRQPGFLLLVSIGVQIPGQDQLPDFHFSIGEAKKLP